MTGSHPHFQPAEFAARIEKLRTLGCEFIDPLPRGLDARQNALLQAPEGTALLLLHSVE